MTSRVLTTALCVFTIQASLAVAEDAWNFERVGTAVTADGNVDLGAYSKLGPWPNPDGNIIYSGCYDPSTLTPDIAGSDRCFATVDISDPANPVRLTTVDTYDREKSPSPPRGHIVWSNDYAFPNVSRTLTGC